MLALLSLANSKKRKANDGLSVNNDSGGAELPAEASGEEQLKDNDDANNESDAPSSHSPTKTPASISHHISTLQRLDEEYANLQTTEEKLEHYLSQLQQEETSLRLALEQSSTSLKEQREKETKRKDEEAVARLEEALMMDGDSDDDSGSLMESSV